MAVLLSALELDALRTFGDVAAWASLRGDPGATDNILGAFLAATGAP